MMKQKDRENGKKGEQRWRIRGDEQELRASATLAEWLTYECQRGTQILKTEKTALLQATKTLIPQTAPHHKYTHSLTYSKDEVNGRQ